MDPKLQAVIDRAEILEVLHQYVHACDRSDEPRLIDTYHPEARDNHDMMGGRYIDKLERREDGKWRVQDRVCTCEWSFTMKVEHEWHKDGKFVCGTFDKTDLSYPVLGLP